jgi:hypothetical protein
MAKSKAELIREAIERARGDWVSYTIEQERKIYTLFEQASDKLTAQIAKFTVEGKIPPARLGILLGQIKAEMDVLRPRLRSMIRRAQSKSVDYGLKTSIAGANAAMPPTFKAGIGTSFFDKTGKIIRHDAKVETYAASAWARINGKAMDALIRTSYGGIAFSRRVWDITWPVERQVRNQINLAVLTGTSADGITRNIRSYLGLPETFRGLAFKEFHPGAGVYKSAYKNALRLAGTEINRGFNEGIFRYGMEKKWVTGYMWRTGSGNPCEECLDEAGNFFPKDNPPYIPLHPFCYCWAEVQYK